MPFRIDNLIVLFGLFALAIPVLLHLLQRRRHDVLDWGAMQFLPDSIATTRRRWLDELLLMLLRMATIALIVLALATPFSTNPWLAPLGDRSTRDIVIVIDGSYSMDARIPGQPTPWDDALQWVRTRIDEAPLGDRFSILIARQPPHFARDDFANDLPDITTQPRGNPDMPGALAQAWKHLRMRSTASAQEIIVLTDGQRHGWADPATLSALDNLGGQWHAEIERAKADGAAIPSLRIVKVGPALPMTMPNYALAPLTVSRGVARLGQRINFQSALHLDDFTKYQKPRAVNVVIDGKTTQTLSLPENIDLKKGQIPLAFQHRFDEIGQHVISLILEADDALPADNVQHAVIEVVKEVPILLVDGDAQLSPEGSTYFLQRALSAQQVIPVAALKALDLAKPAVIVLADVPRLTQTQIAALDRFLADGGGLLIVAGERVAKERTFYNDQLYRQGEGWLPVKLGEVSSSLEGSQPEPRTFQHPALELFRTAPDSMKDVRFPKWLKVQSSAKDRATVLASLTAGDPFLIEKAYKKGRVILCSVPLDRRWGSTLPGAWEFPVLAHELTTYLAGSRLSATTLQHGAPIRVMEVGGAQRLTLQTPEDDAKTVDVKSWPWLFHDTGALGIYRVNEGQGGPLYFVVPPDLREADLARASDDDWRKVRTRLPVVWHDDGAAPTSSIPQERQREDLWWLLLIGVLGLLCMEVWMTRRMALARGR